METRLAQAFLESDVAIWGVCDFEAVRDRLLPCRAAARLPKAPQSVVLALFPYRFPDNNIPLNLSRYAAANDYHVAASTVMERVAAVIRQAGAEAAVFCDNSPIPEVYAAATAGLGVIGHNGLLLNEQFGSFVFIAEIVTDLPLSPTGHTAAGCSGCGKCAAACPAGCTGAADKAVRCLSAITQKKGDLSNEERRLIKENGLCWGCDRCQEVCPCNIGAKISPHPCFYEYTPQVTKADLEQDDLRDKPYGWRGAAVIQRNLAILNE